MDILTPIIITLALVFMVIGIAVTSCYVAVAITDNAKERKIRKNTEMIVGFAESPLTSSEIFRTTNRIVFHRDMVALRKYCFEHTSEHLRIRYRLEEAEILRDYLLKKEDQP